MNNMDWIKRKTGVYMIKSLLNGRTYIGSSSTCLKTRLRHHFKSLERKDHHSRFLQRDFNKNENCFVYGVLEFCSPEMCIEIEQKYLDNMSPDYNHAPVAGCTLGVKHSIETKKKYSLAKKGRTPWNKGKKIGNNFTEDSFKKRKLTLAKNGTNTGKVPKIIEVKGKGKHVTFLKMQYCADFLGVNISYVSTKLKKESTTNIRGYEIKQLHMSNRRI